MVFRSSSAFLQAGPDRLASVTTRPLTYSEVSSDSFGSSFSLKEALGQRKSEVKLILCGTSLVTQWWRLQAPNARAQGLIPGQRIRPHVLHTTKSSHAATRTRHSQIIKHFLQNTLCQI